LRFIHMLYTL